MSNDTRNHSVTDQTHDQTDDRSDITGRRSMLRHGALAVGAGLTGVALTQQPASAASQPVYVDTDNMATARTSIVTSGTNTVGLVATATKPTGFNWGLSGASYSSDGIGVSGTAISAEGATSGVRGRADSPMGTGVLGEAPAGVGAAFTGGRAALRLAPAGETPTTRTDAHDAGEMIFDAHNHLWICTAAGTPGTWHRLTGPTTHPVTPFRVYDSRFGGGKLAGGQDRVVSVRESIDFISGAVIATDIVPAGATAVFFNLTITETVSNGYLATAPGDAAALTTSSINWTGSNNTLANGTLVSIDGNRQIKVFAHGLADAATHFLIDVTGYIA